MYVYIFIYTAYKYIYTHIPYVHAHLELVLRVEIQPGRCQAGYIRQRRAPLAAPVCPSTNQLALAWPIGAGTAAPSRLVHPGPPHLAPSPGRSETLGDGGSKPRQHKPERLSPGTPLLGFFRPRGAENHRHEPSRVLGLLLVPGRGRSTSGQMLLCAEKKK